MGPGLGEKGRRVLECPGFPASSFLDYMAPGVVTMVTLLTLARCPPLNSARGRSVSAP